MTDTPENTPLASQPVPAAPAPAAPVAPITPTPAAAAPAPVHAPAPAPIPAAAPMRPVAPVRPVAPTGIAKAPLAPKFVSPMPKIEESENAVPAVFTVIAGAAAVVTLAFTVLLYLKR